MARKPRQRISYVLPLANSPGGHRLGVNGLAIDADQSILYSGGRDGVICAWNLQVDSHKTLNGVRTPTASREGTSSISGGRRISTTFRKQTQAHTHWINDIVLTQSNAALTSASSDLTVKVWRPHSEQDRSTSTIGLHDDYVKCLASPAAHSDWVASGGLDHKIRIWDLNGAGEKLQIDVGEDDNNAKGSVYALSVRGSLMASGGPESIVRLWDPRSGKQITKFVGHTDNIRDVLVSQDGDTVLTASSDQTVKVWSVNAGRCMYTLTMHNASVWSLYSEHPRLSVFYSGDRSGLIAKTDIRGIDDLDAGLSLAVAQEHEGVNKMLASYGHIWTATSSSSINRWEDVDVDGEVQTPSSPNHQRHLSSNAHDKLPLSTPQSPTNASQADASSKIPLNSVLRISNSVAYSTQKARDAEANTIYSGMSTRKMSEAVLNHEPEMVLPIHDLPSETIEGQNGLIKHMMLSDRRRVLTLDTAGEVIMWDLLKCVPIQSFGKRHLEDVAPEINTVESVANWCTVDTRTGRLACILDENNCFDAEVYADELEPKNLTEFRDDQRINLGKWILRYLFASLIEEEIRRDTSYRENLFAKGETGSRLRRENAPRTLQLPSPPSQTSIYCAPEDGFSDTPRPIANTHRPTTPGLSIGVATPFPLGPNNHAAKMGEEGSSLEKKTSQNGPSRTSTDKSEDYFTALPIPRSPSDNVKGPTTPGDTSLEAVTQSPVDAEREEKPKEGGSIFGKKFRMNFPKKLGRTSVDAKPPVVDEKSADSEVSEDKEDKPIEDSFFGAVQKIRHEYATQLQMESREPLPFGIIPSLPTETPELRLPPSTSIIIQEDRPDSGGVADLYRGTVSSAGRDADVIERTGPIWLGDLLLRNQIPFKEISKVSFVLLPYEDQLSSIASVDGNSRLNANRMLRAKKVLAYVAERIDPQPDPPEPGSLQPEEYLELYCQNQLVPPNTTLATLRTHIWKTGGDVMLYYKSNGRKPEIERRNFIEPDEGSRPVSKDSQMS